MPCVSGRQEFGNFPSFPLYKLTDDLVILNMLSKIISLTCYLLGFRGQDLEACCPSLSPSRLGCGRLCSKHSVILSSKRVAHVIYALERCDTGVLNSKLFRYFLGEVCRKYSFLVCAFLYTHQPTVIHVFWVFEWYDTNYISCIKRQLVHIFTSVSMGRLHLVQPFISITWRWFLYGLVRSGNLIDVIFVVVRRRNILEIVVIIIIIFLHPTRFWLTLTLILLGSYGDGLVHLFLGPSLLRSLLRVSISDRERHSVFVVLPHQAGRWLFVHVRFNATAS